MQDCYHKIIDDLKKDQNKYCKKSCQVKEYNIVKVGDHIKDLTKYYGNNLFRKDRAWKNWKNKNWTWNGTFTSENGRILEWRFVQPKWRREQRSEAPFKTVHREMLKMSGMSLIGNVGGTLGMFIGFSFIGTSEWLLEKLGKWHTKIV